MGIVKRERIHSMFMALMAVAMALTVHTAVGFDIDNFTRQSAVEHIYRRPLRQLITLQGDTPEAERFAAQVMSRIEQQQAEILLSGVLANLTDYQLILLESSFEQLSRRQLRKAMLLPVTKESPKIGTDFRTSLSSDVSPVRIVTSGLNSVARTPSIGSQLVRASKGKGVNCNIDIEADGDDVIEFTEKVGEMAADAYNEIKVVVQEGAEAAAELASDAWNSAAGEWFRDQISKVGEIISNKLDELVEESRKEDDDSDSDDSSDDCSGPTTDRLLQTPFGNLFMTVPVRVARKVKTEISISNRQSQCTSSCAEDDPHMTGFDGARFLFVGDDEHLFNILSDQRIAVYAGLMSASHGRTFFNTFKVQAGRTRVKVLARNGTHGAAVLVNGQKIDRDTVRQLADNVHLEMYDMDLIKFQVVLRTPTYVLNISGHASAEASQHLNFYAQLVGTPVRPTGLLGSTLDSSPESKSAAEMSQEEMVEQFGISPL